jgi:hypothetical protein
LAGIQLSYQLSVPAYANICHASSLVGFSEYQTCLRDWRGREPCGCFGDAGLACPHVIHETVLLGSGAAVSEDFHTRHDVPAASVFYPLGCGLRRFDLAAPKLANIQLRENYWTISI